MRDGMRNQSAAPQNPKDGTGESVPIDQLTEKVIRSFAGKFHDQMIKVDADIETVSAPVNSQSIHAAVSKLIENAIDSMPDGGNINVTLIDGQHHWELEVADSVGEIYGDRWKKEVESNNDIHSQNLLRISAENPQLETVRSVANSHGGQLQSWVFPQGGAAHVLIIPRRQPRNLKQKVRS